MRSLVLFTCFCLAGSPPIPSPATTVQSYLSALKVFDHRGMSQFWADDAVSETAGIGPDARPIDGERVRAVRGFEREKHTKGSWTITDGGASGVTVTLSVTKSLYYLFRPAVGVPTAGYSN